MKYPLVIFILFLSLLSQAQVKYKTLIIDTLITNDYRFYISRTDPFIDFEPIAIDTENLTYRPDSFPNLMCKVDLFNDSAIVRLAIDNKSGYLELNNLYNLEVDTIRINRIEIFENYLCDTTFDRITYWKETDTGIIEPPLKEEFNAKAINCSNKEKQTEQITFIINNRKYLCLLVITPQSIQYMHFHGRKPRKYSNNRDNYHGKKKIYFSGREIRVEYIYTCELELIR